MRRDRHQRARRNVELRKLVAVAAAVVMVGAGFGIARELARPDPAVAQIIELQAPAGCSGRAVARVRATDTGGLIEMEVEGLSKPPPGSFYEC